MGRSARLGPDIRRIEELAGAPAKIASVGQSRGQTIIYSNVDWLAAAR